MIELGVNGESVGEAGLITGRSCIIAQSGAGKSYGLAVICEQLAGQGFGFCIIDTEGEYFSLKQEFDVLWVGGEAADVDVNTVDLTELAFKVVSEGVPVILDVSEARDFRGVVGEWISSLYKAASELKNPYLLIIEEADKFIPQQGDKLEIIFEVARRGRKRGLGLLVASQRPALINKEVLSQCNHQFIGRLTVENDLEAVKHFFSNREELKSLPDLLPGEFYLIGFEREESLFKFKNRVTKHKGITPNVKRGLTPRIEEVISSLSKDSGLGVKALISKEEAEALALKNARKKYLLFGEKEQVESIKLFYKPLIELSVKVFQKKFFSSAYHESLIYFTPDLKVVNKDFSTMFDLSFMKDLSKKEAAILIQLLYSNDNTISELEEATSLPDDDLRLILKKLINDDFIKHSSWKGDKRVFEVIKDVALPRVSSLCSDEINTNVRVNEELSFKKELFKRVVESLDSKVNVTGSKVIYYPFYKVILRRGINSRALLINAVTGSVT